MSNAVDGAAFVSLVPGSLPDIGAVLIDGRMVEPSFGLVVEGGLDPVAVRAVAGRKLEVTVYGTVIGSGGPVVWGLLAVPDSKPPAIIRTDPESYQRNVWLNLPLQVVFSEPIDAASLTWHDFDLRSSGNTVAGQFRFANPEHTVVEFTPAANLAPSTEYELVLRSGIRDLEGTPLEAGAKISFTTAPALTPPPAGTQLAFVRDDQIHLVNSDGTGLVQLTNTGPGVWNRDPAWSPDGQRLPFTSNRDDPRPGVLPVFGTLSDIYAMNADGSDVVRLTSGGYNGEPAWSPDGRVIAFTSIQNGSVGVSVTNPDGGGRRVLLDRSGIDINPAWSPNGQKITFTSDWRAPDFVYDLYVMNADGSSLRTLIEGPFSWNDLPMSYYFQSAWAPHGYQIAVTLCRGSFVICYPSAIAVAFADGSGLKVIAEAGGYARPTWSPDGHAIAFGSSRCHTCPSSIRFARVDVAGEGFIVTNGHSPAWRP